MTTSDRNRQYGTIALKNNWITQEQLNESLALVARVADKDPQRKFQLEDVLLEKGLISDIQHQAVLGVLERLSSQQRKATSKRQPATPSAPAQTVKCPHCGATNTRGTEECRECEGFIPLDGDEKQIGLIQSRTCPTCTRGLGPEDLSCGCGAMFCPACKGLRLITEPTCRHCKITFPGMEAVAAARAAALASGAIKTKPKPTLADTQMPRWMGPSIALALILIAVFTYRRYAVPDVDLEAWRLTDSEVSKLESEGHVALASGNFNEARARYRAALSAAQRLVALSEHDERRETEAQRKVFDMEAKLALVERKAAEPPPTLIPLPDDPVGSGSTTPGSGSTRIDTPDGPTRPAVVILPRDMTDEEKRAAHAELAALGIELVRPREIAADKRIVLFLREDKEVAGELLGTADGKVIVRDLAGDEQKVDDLDIRGRALGKLYDPGAVILELRKPDDSLVRGAPEGLSRKGELLWRKDGRSSIVVREDEVVAIDYYRASRHAAGAPTVRTHLLLGNLCWRLKLFALGLNEYLLAAALDVDAALYALPQLAPDRFIAWRTRRPGATAAEIAALLAWVADGSPAARIQALRYAITVPELGKTADVHTAYVNALADGGKMDEAEAHLKAEIARSEGEKRFLLGEFQKTLETSRAERERERINLMKRDVPIKFVGQLDRELDAVEREVDLKVALRRIRERATFTALLEKTAAETTVPLADAYEAFQNRRHLRLEAMAVNYGEGTWLVDPPAAMIFAQSLGVTSAQQQSHWVQLAMPLRRAVLRGQFFEAWYTCEVTRTPCPTCQGARALTDFSRVADVLRQIDPECRGTGYQRALKAK